MRLTITSFVFILMLASCSKEGLDETILGRWQLESMTTSCDPSSSEIQEGTVDADGDGCIAEDNGSFPSSSNCIYIEFFDDSSAYFINVEDGEEDTSYVFYITNNNEEVATICPPGTTTCLGFKFEDGRLSHDFPLVNLAGEDCLRRLDFIKS